MNKSSGEQLAKEKKHYPAGRPTIVYGYGRVVLNGKNYPYQVCTQGSDRKYCRTKNTPERVQPNIDTAFVETLEEDRNAREAFINGSTILLKGN